MLWGSPIELSKQAQLKNRLKESLLKNRRILSAYNLTEQDLTKHVRFLEHYRPEYLYGYATILTAFAQTTCWFALFGVRISAKLVRACP